MEICGSSHLHQSKDSIKSCSGEYPINNSWKNFKHLRIVYTPIGCTDPVVLAYTNKHDS